MKLYIVTANLDRGVNRAYQRTFKRKENAVLFVNDKFKQEHDVWEGDILECHTLEHEWSTDPQWCGYVEITTINTATMKG